MKWADLSSLRILVKRIICLWNSD